MNSEHAFLLETTPESSLSPESDGAEDMSTVGMSTHAGEGEEDSARSQVRLLIERTRQARPTSDTDLLMRAYAFAHEKHAGQKRMTGEPYIEHPIAVAGILAELGMDDPTLAAGLLHDVIEDCGVDYEDMTRRFGAEVAQLVEGVTKLKHIDFNSKQEKQAENLRKLFLAMAGDVRVIIIKLADRLHNMRTLDPFPEVRKREIASETLQILAPIAHRLGIWRIKWELEDKAFKYLEPDTYKQIYALVQSTRAERAALVEESIHTLQQRLKAENISAEVTGRPKHFYSIYQKMIKQGRKFDELHDLIALRVICPTEADCYHALGIVHGQWLVLPEMFFDYIAKPKPNNYQSLHTKVLGPGGQPIEVQIRTREMHREAEFGIAAHWRYKEGEGAKAGFGAPDNIGSKLKWLRLVLELQSDTKDDAQGFLDSLKLDLYTDQIFAFTPRGDVIYLPQDSTPVDFAYRVHSDIGSTCVGAKVNGRLVPLDYKLHNGDICEIQTARASRAGVGPKRDWLEFVVTPHAKNRIKNFLKKQNFDDNLREGTERLEKAASIARFKLSGAGVQNALQKQARAHNYKTLNDLIAAIGYGEHSADTVLNRVRTETESERRLEREKQARARAANQNMNEALPGQQPLSGIASSLLTRNIKTRTERDSGDLSGGLQIGPRDLPQLTEDAQELEAARMSTHAPQSEDENGVQARAEKDASAANSSTEDALAANALANHAEPNRAELNRAEAKRTLAARSRAGLGADLLFSLAKCCAPIPGDLVRGYITRGRGVTVHRDDCPNLKHYEAREPDRLIQAHWTGDGDHAYRALIAIEARDRTGLLYDVTSVISERNINIHAVNTYPLKDSRARLNIAVTISGLEQLSNVMDALRSIEAVNDVHRV